MAIDSLGTALPNGVYDPRLGPTTADSPPCTTCALGFLDCPGHFGHIELIVPVYHPLLFSKMVELLRIKCFHCHKLLIGKRQLKLYKVKFELLKHGRYFDALELDNRIANVVKTETNKGDKSKDPNREHEKNLEVDSMLKEIEESMASNSRGQDITLSSLEEAKFQELVKGFISDCKGRKNCQHCGAYSPRIRQDSSNKVFQSPLSATAKRWNAAEGLILKPALAKRSDSDDDDEIDDTFMMDDDDDDVDDDEREKGPVRDKYMHAREVQAQVKRTWESSPEICNAVFSVQGYEVFFMQAIAVPPNRFRPPMHLGGMVVEHGQNQYLNKIITNHELVRSNFASNNEAAAYKFWIELQTSVNIYMDSAKDPSINPNAPPGIRQLLERKEGMFRKHMMGKRVNFACRSVISPDPYIGTNEIGLPRYFVETLTYPTPVTDINIEEMRRLVERGPKQYPGARWVEFPDKRVDLSKMDNHQREAVASRLLMYAKKGGQPAIVGRQMRDGDMVLMNRQVRRN